MLYFIKGFLKIQLENDDLFSRLMTHVKVFKGPCKTVMDSSCLDEPILIFMNELLDYFLEPVCKKFCDNLYCNVEQGNGFEIIDSRWTFSLGDQSNVRRIKALKTGRSIKERLNKIIKIMFDN